MSRYDGKKAIITGGTTGIGLATAKLLVTEGARVIVTGRSKGAIESAKAELGARAEVLASDTSKLADLDALAARAKASLGTVDFVFINAGVAKFAPLDQTDEATYDDLFATNARGAFFAIQKLAPLVPRGGSFVLNTSAVDVKGLPSTSAYSATKAALRSFARTLATELVPQGIRVNAVSPGPVVTPIMDKAGLTAEARAGFETLVPMKRMGLAEEVARAALYLAFDATFTTGAELPVDGGITQL